MLCFICTNRLGYPDRHTQIPRYTSEVLFGAYPLTRYSLLRWFCRSSWGIQWLRNAILQNLITSYDQPIKHNYTKGSGTGRLERISILS